MLGRTDGQGWVEHSWELADPDLVEDSLKKISIFTQTAFDAVWQHLLEYDADEMQKTRDMMKMQLARYAKQDLHKWDNIEVSELRRWWYLLKETINDESPITTATED